MSSADYPSLNPGREAIAEELEKVANLTTEEAQEKIAEIASDKGYIPPTLEQYRKMMRIHGQSAGALFFEIKDTMTVFHRAWQDLLDPDPAGDENTKLHLMADTRDPKKYKTSIENFKMILRNDPYFSDIRMNELSGQVTKDGKPWTDADESAAKSYIESAYGMHSAIKFQDAFNIVTNERQYNPFTETVEKIEWDGNPHCKGFLSRWMKAKNDEYTQEVSRILFAGIIHRAFDPGCQFDLTLVFMGKQGCGKSSLCQLLALSPDYFTSLTSLSDVKTAGEIINGKIVVELSELTAYKGDNATKDFLTRRSDRFRGAYQKNASDHARSCVTIGTTNSSEFIVDTTGGRRWLPIRFELDESGWRQNLKMLDKLKGEILQCYAEMYHAYQTGDKLAEPCENEEVLSLIRSRQEIASVDDWRIPVIEAYIDKLKAGWDTNDEIVKNVCVSTRELWHEALYPVNKEKGTVYREPTRTEQREVGSLLTNKLADEWECGEKTERNHKGLSGMVYPSAKLYHIRKLNRDNYAVNGIHSSFAV